MRSWLLLAAAIAAAASLALGTASSLLRPEPAAPRLEEASSIAEALESAGEIALSHEARVEVEPVELVVEVPEGAISISAARVRICFRVPSAPELEPPLEALWGVWANRTHAGVLSGASVADSGTRVLVRYAASTPGAANRLSVAGDRVVLQASFESARIYFAGRLVYEFDGYREVVVEEVEVGH